MRCFVLGVLFPIGEFGIYVNIFDKHGGQSYQFLSQCEVVIQDNECVDLNETIEGYVNNHPYASQHSVFSYIFQTVQTAVLYIKAGSIENDQCSISIVVEIVDILTTFFSSNVVDLCQSDYVLVC